MKPKSLLALAFGFLLAMPAAAEVTINELLLRKQGEDINIRIVLGNPANETQRGPIKVVLYVRPDSMADLQEIKVWDDIAEIKPGDRVARDLFGENSAVLRNTAAIPGWEARAWVEAAGTGSVSLNVISD